MIKKIILILTFIIVFSLNAAGNEFCGCIKRIPVNEPFMVSWAASIGGADGYELKIIHYFYDGLETDIKETTDTTYTFNNLPKSSRHFEVKIRAFNNRVDNTREYSVWVSSTDKEYATYNGEACGWLIYAVPSAPSW